MFWRGSNISDHFKEKAEDGDVRNILNAFESVDADAGLVTIRSNLLGTPYSFSLAERYQRGAATEEGFLGDLEDTYARFAGDKGFGGGFSKARGDVVVGVGYFLATTRFWWTRNDPYEKRFAYDMRYRSWRPLKGSGVIYVGNLALGNTYALSPTPYGCLLYTSDAADE